MRISFSLKSILMFIVLVTVFMFATAAAMAEKGSRLSDKSVVAVALKSLDVGGVISTTQAPDDVGVVSLIPKGDGVIVAAALMATAPHGKGKKVIYLTNTITMPATKGDAIGHYMITNSRPTWRLDFAHYRTGFPLRT